MNRTTQRQSDLLKTLRSKVQAKHILNRSEYSVRDVMTPRVFAVSAHDHLGAVYDIMETLNVRHVPVVDREDNLLGLISERDMVQSAVVSGAEDLPITYRKRLLESQKVSEIMKIDVETVDPEEDLKEAGRIMLENKFGCLPVVEGSKIVGILTEADFIRFVIFSDCVH